MFSWKQTLELVGHFVEEDVDLLLGVSAHRPTELLVAYVERGQFHGYSTPCYRAPLNTFCDHEDDDQSDDGAEIESHTARAQ